MKIDLNRRLKKIERLLNAEKKEHKIFLVDLVYDTNSKYKKLLKREKNGNKVDWDNNTIIHLRDLKGGRK